MKSFFKTLIVVCFIAAYLIGCGKEPEAVTLTNEIAPKELSQEQQDIVSLLSGNKHEILLFDYKLEEAYKSVEYWVEVYENGVLAARPAVVNSVRSETQPFEGQLAIVITQNPGFQWTFTISEGGSKMSHTSEPLDADNSGMGRAYGPISEPLAIESGKEIVLYVSLFSSHGISIYTDKQIFVEQPELINEYPYAHIIKAKFVQEET